MRRHITRPSFILVAVAGNCAAICAGKTALDSSCLFERQHLVGYLILPLEKSGGTIADTRGATWASCNSRPIDVDGWSELGLRRSATLDSQSAYRDTQTALEMSFSALVEKHEERKIAQ